MKNRRTTLYAKRGSTVLTILRTILSLSKDYTLYAMLIALVCLILPQLALAKTIYVDNQLPSDCSGTYSIANRDNSGSDGDAYNTPQEAANVVEPGDIVYFRAGTYYQHQSLTDAAVLMNILRSGTVDNLITFKNYNNEEAILSGMRPSGTGHFYSVTLGVQPSSSLDISGQGVQNILIEGLIIEGASRVGLSIFGPANKYATAENPTENVIIRKVIARNNSGGNGWGMGIASSGTLINVIIEYCEAYNNTGNGISLGRVEKEWHVPEPDDDMSAAQYSIVRNCLSYNNAHPVWPGNTDGMGGSNMYRCTFDNNIVFGNSDDGMDIYTSIETTVKNNIVFGQSTEGGNNCGIKFSAGGGGRHTIAGNLVFNNKGYSLEGSKPSNLLRSYYPSRLYNNIACNGSTGISLGYEYTTTYPGYEKTYLRNNVAIDNNNDIFYALQEFTDSDYNFFSSASNLATMQGRNQDAHSLTGDPQLVNKEVVIDTNFGSVWTIEQKLEHIRSQVRTAFSLNETSQLIDAGTLIEGYHCLTSGAHPGEACKEWYGTAPDIGAYEYVAQGAVLYGDISGDSEVSAYDAALTAQAAVGLITLTAEQAQKADVSGDAEVSAYDAALIAQYAVGLIDKFPVE